MSGWTEDRLMAVYDTIYDISEPLRVDSLAHRLCIEMLDAIENLDDAIREQTDD